MRGELLVRDLFFEINSSPFERSSGSYFAYSQEHPKWLGMLLGVRLYYQFCGVVLESETAFEAKVDELCRELGERGKA